MHVAYLLNLFRPNSTFSSGRRSRLFQDLAGKKVNFNTLGTAAAYSGPLIFSRLGVNIDKTFIPHQVALQQMRKGDHGSRRLRHDQAGRRLRSRPVEPGFKFLPVSHDSKFEDYYLPAFLEASDYPALVKAGERIPTLAVPTVLATYNWPANSNRYQRVARFTDYLFSSIDKLQVPRLRRQLEDDQPRRDGARPQSLPPGTGMAGSPGSPERADAMKIRDRLRGRCAGTRACSNDGTANRRLRKQAASMRSLANRREDEVSGPALAHPRAGARPLAVGGRCRGHGSPRELGGQRNDFADRLLTRHHRHGYGRALRLARA